MISEISISRIALHTSWLHISLLIPISASWFFLHLTPLRRNFFPYISPCNCKWISTHCPAAAARLSGAVCVCGRHHGVSVRLLPAAVGWCGCFYLTGPEQLPVNQPEVRGNGSDTFIWIRQPNDSSLSSLQERWPDLWGLDITGEQRPRANYRYKGWSEN